MELKDNFYRITVGSSDKVNQEMNGLLGSHNHIMDFIFESAKQMAALTQNDLNEDLILRTPSRRTSNRKRSSAALMAKPLLSPKPCLSTTKSSRKGVSSAFKTRDVLHTTPRRVSKRTKRSTVQLDATLEQMDVQEVEAVEEVISCVKKLMVRTIDQNCENRLISASELMSELSIKDEAINGKKLNESDNEWLTDDEDCPPKKETEEFFDAIDAKDKEKVGVNRDVNQRLNSSVNNKTLISNSSSKPKRKKSLYFTPQTTQGSTRAQTRMLSRIAYSAQKTLQTTGLANRKDSTLTGSGESKAAVGSAGSSSTRSMRSYSRIQSKADTKTMTASAQKRRQEAEERRRQQLLASQEKEKRAIEKRRELIEQTVNEKKLKSQEKANRVAEMRELNKKKELERQRNESQKEKEKREEWERRREEQRREQMRKRHEEMLQKSHEIERRKQLQELKESEARLQKQVELNRKQEQERERQREQDRMVALIQQHNSSLQQKALANSFAKKCESNAQLMPKVMVTKLSPEETEQHLKSNQFLSNEPKVEPMVTQSVKEPNVSPKPKDRTFVVNKEDSTREVSSYDMTPPPREHDYDNYDISQIQSDDDTDDEQQPRKRIPVWARGPQFIKQVHQQYNKSVRRVNREVKDVFGSGEAILNQFKVDFDLMFPKKSVHPKYAKRTSSAVWASPPTRYRPNDSSSLSDSVLSEF